MIKELFEWLIGANALRKRAATRGAIEEAVRDHERAFAEAKAVYNEQPVKQAELRKKLERAGTPFADLELLMRNELRKRRRSHARSKKYE